MPRIASVYGKDPKKLPFDFPDVLAAIAPRPLFIHAPLGDKNFHAGSVRRCLAAAQSVYRLYGAEDRIQAIYPAGGHDFPPEARAEAYRFIARAFAGENTFLTVKRGDQKSSGHMHCCGQYGV